MQIRLSESTIAHIILFLVGHMIAASVFVFHMYMEVNDLKLQYTVTNQIVNKAISNLESIKDTSSKGSISIELMSQRLEIFLKQHNEFREEVKQEIKNIKTK